MDLGVSGLASGFDWRELISQLIEVERAPEQRLSAEQNTINQRNNAYGTIKTQLGTLATRIDALKDPLLFDSRQVAVGDATVASASAGAAADLGSYNFEILGLATASAQRGTSDVAQALHDSEDVSELVLSSANLAKTITAGTLSVNGKQVTLEVTDTLQGVFDKISTATGGAVTGTYDPATDRINLTSASEIVLGSSNDTSNFLAVARLENNGTEAVSSAGRLGSVRLDAALSNAHFLAPISDGGAGEGEFRINGVSIKYNTTESVSGILSKINSSAAGVTATYNSVADQFILTNKATGDLGVGLEDVTGNFLEATGLSAGSLQHGRNLRYTLNGGEELTSHSNTIDESSSGLAGISLTALQEGTTTLTVSTDTDKIKTAIQDFISEYNKVQSVIDTQTASSTDAKGKVTAGLLAGDGDADTIASQLRHIAYALGTGGADTIKQLADLGITTSGNDDSLLLEDETVLDAALADHLTSVRSLFTDSSNGLAVKLSSYIEATCGDEGTLTAKQANLVKAAANIDTQIADMERNIASVRERLTNSFLAMEQAQAKSSQQLQYLQQQLNSS